MTKPRFGAAMLCITVALSLSACSTNDPSSGASPASKKTVIYTEGAKTVTDWDHFVAEHKEMYAAHGVTIDGVDTQTATAATQLLVTGEADIGRGLPPAIQSVANSNGGVKLVSVADLLVRPPFIMNAAKDIDSWDELKGKKIGVSSPTDSTAVVTKEAVTALGFQDDDVELVSSGGTGARYAAMEGGAIDASLLLPPVNFTAEEGGFSRVGYLPEIMGKDWQFAFTSVIVNPAWAEKNREALVAFLAGRNDALKWLADPANRDEAVGILATETKISKETADKIYDLMGIGTADSAFAAEIGVSEVAAGGVLRALQGMDQAPGDMDLASMIDDQYAAEARK
jgi:ABC-type nitrate/sulfonate/bicarbonate transport system substrate-binding protein